MKLDPDSDVPPHEWRRRRQTRTRSANGASFAANMFGARLSRQLIPNNAKLPFLHLLRREKWFSSLVWLFSQRSKFPDPFTCGRQPDCPSHVSVSNNSILSQTAPSKDILNSANSANLDYPSHVSVSMMPSQMELAPPISVSYYCKLVITREHDMYWHKCSKSKCTEKMLMSPLCTDTTEAENMKIELEFWKQNWQKAGLKIL